MDALVWWLQNVGFWGFTSSLNPHFLCTAAQFCLSRSLPSVSHGSLPPVPLLSSPVGHVCSGSRAGTSWLRLLRPTTALVHWRLQSITLTADLQSHHFRPNILKP